MSGIQKFIGGIILVAIGLVLFLTASGIFPAIGVVIAVLGSALIIYALTVGGF